MITLHYITLPQRGSALPGAHATPRKARSASHAAFPVPSTAPAISAEKRPMLRWRSRASPTLSAMDCASSYLIVRA